MEVHTDFCIGAKSVMRRLCLNNESMMTVMIMKAMTIMVMMMMNMIVMMTMMQKLLLHWCQCQVRELGEMVLLFKNEYVLHDLLFYYFKYIKYFLFLILSFLSNQC